jgi:hypothetical protein
MGDWRLRRSASESGSQWSETTFSEGGWLDYLPFRSAPTVDYHGGKVSANAIAAMAISPDGIFVWTVSLDHTLKAWDTRTGKVVAETDLLGEHLSVEEKKRHVNSPMTAEQGTLIQVVKPKNDENFDYNLLVHSPKDHQFKFFGVKNTKSEEGDFPQTSDLQPGKKLIPPIDDLLNTNIWHLEQFFVNAGPEWRISQLWLRARSGAVCKTFMLSFDLSDDPDEAKELSDTFKHGWSVVDSSSLTIDKLKQLPDFQGLEAVTESTTTPSEKWLDFLFFPSRFSAASLETALYIYRKGRGLTGSTSSKGLKTAEEPLKERITSAVASKILLRRLQNEQPDYDRYQLDLQAQWTTFFSLLSHLHSRRHESIGSAFDAEHGLAWTVCADFIAPIRTSGKFDLLNHNAELCMNGDALETIDPQLYDDIFGGTAEDILRTQILAVAKQFRNSLSPAAQENLRVVATTNALDRSDDAPSTEEGLQLLYDRAGFVAEISDDDFEALEVSASSFQGLGTLSDDSFLAVLEVLDHAPEPRGFNKGLTLGRYGKDVNIAIAQESILEMQSALLDVLALIIFMAYELDENDLSPEFHPRLMYESFMAKVAVTELRLWLVRNVRRQPMRATSSSSAMMMDTTVEMSIYESLFAGDWTVIARGKIVNPSTNAQLETLLTTWATHWTFGLDLNKQWSEITTWAMADLLRHREIDLAADFAKFLPEDSSWATYLKARLDLAMGDYARASLSFIDASHDMASISNARNQLKGDLLTPEDMLLIGKGPSPYFQHVLALFEKLKVFSYTADFASLALQYLPTRKDILRHYSEIDMRKSKTDSPPIEAVKNSGQEIKLMQQQQIRDDILGRLFNALVQTGRFEAAYSGALGEMMDPMIKRSNLRILVKACTKRSDPTGAAVLLGLGIEGDLVQVADEILLELARDAMEKSPAAGISTSGSAPAYHQILFAYRTGNGDFRGAAAILYEHLERLRNCKGVMRGVVDDPEDETLVRVYALLINTLGCCGEGEGWLLAPGGFEKEGGKRKLVRLEDVRREYVRELDRRSDLVMGRFGILGGEMEVFQ